MADITVITTKIENYYLEHFAELSERRRFHFESRLHLWTGGKFTHPWLDEVRPNYLVESTADFEEFCEKIDKNRYIPEELLNYELRKEHLQKYPELLRLGNYMFQTMMAETVYGHDFRDILKQGFGEEIRAIVTELENDDSALAMLSTHAINFIYIYYLSMQRSESGVDIEQMLGIAEAKYDLTDRAQLQLCIYFYTHCIIGESRFYFRKIPPEKLPQYKEVLNRLEMLIAENYFNISLDNKFEFLVCCRICDHETNLERLIESEARVSMAGNADYLVNKYNLQIKPEDTIENAEHSNVLWLMSQKNFTPIG